MLKYFFTKFGDVYSGWHWDERLFPDYTIIIQSKKLKGYRALNHKEKTIEKIREYGWVIDNNAIVEILSTDEFNPSDNNHIGGDSYSSNFERKTMFVFGAGASANCTYGSEKDEFNDDVLRPPLGPALFNKRFKNHYLKYKGVKQSLHFLQEENSNVEELLEKEWKSIQTENNQEVLSRHINIQYYLQEILSRVSQRVIHEYYGKNLYAKLADQLQKIHSSSIVNRHGQVSYKKFGFVSFNQDTILEHFISEYFKKPINSMNDYVNINDSPFCIFKPHGSWNWGWRFPDPRILGGNASSWLFDNNINFYELYYQLLGDRVNMIDWSTWGYEAMISKDDFGKHTIDKSQLKIITDGDFDNYYPGMLLPYSDKDEFTMPLKHFYNMHIYLSQVETLVIIGWKGNEDVFNRQLFDCGGQIKKVIIADPDSEGVIKHIQPLLNKNNITPIVYRDFEHFVMEGVEKELKS